MAQVSSVPAENSATASHAERQSLARRYARSQRFLLIATYLLFGIGGLWVFSASLTIREWAQGISTDPGVIVGLYAVAAGGVYLALLLPGVFMGGYVAPRRFGLYTRPLAGWWLDYLKSVCLLALPWVAGLESIYWLMRAFPDGWWLPAAALLWLFSVAMEYLLPTIVWPIFFKLRPLEDFELAQRLAALAERSGAPALGVYVMELSSHTPAINAWLTGLGRTRRIVLADTLLDRFSYDEIETILAHELAHHVHNDIPKRLAVKAVVTLACMWAAWHALDWFSYGGDLAGPADVAAFPHFGIALCLSLFLSVTVGNFLSRRAERAADLYALRATGKYEAFHSAMIKLADQNLTEANPSRGSLHTHPATVERLRMADEFLGRTTAVVQVAPPSRPIKQANFLVGVSILAVAIMGTILAAYAASGLTSYSESDPPPAGPTTGAASNWADQLAAAQEEAAKVGEEAVLKWVGAGPVAGPLKHLDENTTFLVDFYYISPKGTSFMVQLVDVAPPKIHNVVFMAKSGKALSQQQVGELQSYADALPTIELSPREVYRETLAEGLAFGKEQGEATVYPSVSLFLDRDEQTGDEMRAKWGVAYYTTNKLLELWVHPQSGRVMERKIEDVVDEEDY